MEYEGFSKGSSGRWLCPLRGGHGVFPAAPAAGRVWTGGCVRAVRLPAGAAAFGVFRQALPPGRLEKAPGPGGRRVLLFGPVLGGVPHSADALRHRQHPAGGHARGGAGRPCLQRRTYERQPLQPGGQGYEYLAENPGALCIVTGGQGKDEPCPEAVTEKNALVGMGIQEERIFVEDQSHNTRENLQFAQEIAQEQGMGEEIAVVTQGFHMYRATQLAKAAGFTPYSLVAETEPLLFPEYYGRELLSLTKWQVEHLLLD